MTTPDRSILDAIRLHRLTGEDGTAPIDWRLVAELLAEQLDALRLRFTGTTPADEERVARAALALEQYRAACLEIDDPT